MAGPYNSSVVQTELRYQMDNQEVENTLYFIGDPFPDEADLDSLNSDLLNWWSTNIKPLQGSQVALNTIYSKSLASAVAPEATLPVLSGNVGTALGNPEPNSVTLAIAFKTGLQGRSNRGRNYIIGLTDIMITDNTVNPDVVADWVTAYLTLLPGGGVLSGFEWCVYSRQTAGEVRPTGVAVNITAAVVTNNVIDNQRRRLPGRGR